MLIHPQFLLTAVEQEIAAQRAYNRGRFLKRYPLGIHIRKTPDWTQFPIGTHPRIAIAILVREANRVREWNTTKYLNLRHDPVKWNARLQRVSSDGEKRKQRIRRARNKDLINQRMRAYRKQPHAKKIFAIASKKYREQNRDKVRKRKRDRHKMAMAQNPTYRLRRNLHVLMRLNGGKRKRTEVVIGCKIEQFKEWIESQFKPGMSFEDRRAWHIDHIFPLACCGGDKALMERSFHFKNLRPEWGADNVRKGDQVILYGVRSAQECGIMEIHLKKKSQIDFDALELAKQIGMRIYVNGGLLS